MLSTQRYYEVDLSAAENALAQCHGARNEQSWALDPGCLVLEPMYLTVMQMFSAKAGKVLGNQGPVGHSVLQGQGICYEILKAILVSLGSHNKVPHTGWL